MNGINLIIANAPRKREKSRILINLFAFPPTFHSINRLLPDNTTTINYLQKLQPHEQSKRVLMNPFDTIFIYESVERKVSVEWVSIFCEQVFVWIIVCRWCGGAVMMILEGKRPLTQISKEFVVIFKRMMTFYWKIGLHFMYLR